MKGTERVIENDRDRCVGARLLFWSHYKGRTPDGVDGNGVETQLNGLSQRLSPVTTY